jgi:biopolymer transport protein ExbD
MNMRKFFIFAGILSVLMLAAGCGPSVEERARALKERSSVTVNLPKAMTNAEDAPEIKEDSGKVVTETRGDYYVGSFQYPIDVLPDKVHKDYAAAPNSPVYFQADYSEDYGRIIEALDAIRKAGANNVGLLVNPGDNGPPRRLLVSLPPEPMASERLQPGTLQVEFTKDDKLTIDGKDAGTPDEPKIADAIKAAAGKPVTIKGRKDSRYVDVVRTVNAAKAAGATTIILAIDDLA